jgi:hypothetical protein
MYMDRLLQFHLIERRTPYEISEQLAFRGGHMWGEPGQEPTAVLSLQVDEQTLGYVELLLLAELLADQRIMRVVLK